MALTYDPIATTTLGSANSTITFSSIPGTFTDLRLVIVANQTGSNDLPVIRFNGDTGNNYSHTHIGGNGSAGFSGRSSNASGIRFMSNTPFLTGSRPNLTIVDIFSYSATSVFKSVLANANNNDGGSGSIWRSVGLWRNTAAITSVTLNVGIETMTAGSTATLYGILRA